MAVHYGLTRRGHGSHSANRVTPSLPPEPPQPARDPEAIDSAQSGPWNVGTTWVDGLIPTIADTFTIKAGHFVTSNLNVTVGHSPGAADAVQAGLIEATGQLKITGGIFTVRGDLKLSASDSVRSLIVNGGTLQFDASHASVPSTAQYQLIQPAQTTGVQPSALFQGSSLNRVTVKSVTTGGAAKALFRGTGANKFSLLEAYFTDFSYLGDSTHDWVQPSITSGSTFIIDHCTSDNCGRINLNGVSLGATATFRLQGFVVTNSVQSTSLGTASFGAMTAGGQRLIQDTYFDKSVDIYSPRDFTYRRVVFNAAWTTTDAAPGYWATMDNCLVRQTANDLNLNGPVTNCYSLYDNVARTNPHNWQPGTYAIGTYTIDGNVFEFTGTDATGDCIVIGQPSIATTYNIVNNVFLPNAGGDNSGTPFSALPTDGSNNTINFTHNTYMIGTQGVAVGETYVGHAGMLASFKSNLGWDTSARGYLLYDSGADNNVPDLVASGNADYNCGYNYLTGSNLKGYNGLEFTSGNPGQHDKNVDPAFVDSARNIAKWDLSLGGAGTVAAALARIKADTTQIAGLISYVKAGFAPTNEALVGAGHDGDDIGAVTVQASSGPVDDPPDTEPTPIIQPVARKDEWWTRIKPFSTALLDWYEDNNHPPIDAGYDPYGYYDGQLCAQRLEDYWTGEESTWQDLQDEVDDAYRIYHVNANSGAVNVIRAFPEGMYERYVRRSSPAAVKTSMLSLYNATYVSSNASSEDLSQTIYSREVAYALNVHVQTGRAAMGYTLSSAQLARRQQHYTWALTHMQKWAAYDVQYCRPFMMGLTCKALIDYYYYVSQDTIIIDRIRAGLDYIWDSCWKATAGAWGRANAFTYTDRPTDQMFPLTHRTSQALDQFTQPDLNMIVCPAFGWMYHVTGESKWRTRGDQIFTGSIPIYNGNVGVSGADLGQPNQYVSGKRHNQQLYWGPKYFLWAEGQVATAPPDPDPDPETDPPPDYSGLTQEIYLTAGDATTLLDGAGAATGYSGVVGQWSDKTTNARHFLQATNGSRPLRGTATNGSSTFDVVNFDATDDRLIGNSAALSCATSKGCLIIAVSGKITTRVATMGLFTIYTSSAGNPRARCAFLSDGQWATEARRLDADSTTSAFSGAATQYTTDTWGVHCWVFDYSAATLRVYFNKVLKASTTLSVSGNSDSSNSAASGVFLGSYNSGSGFATKSIRDVVVYSATTTPSQSQIDQIQIDLATGVGVTLPSTTTGYPIGFLLSLTKEA